MDRPWRVVFFGTPDFAVPALKRLAETEHRVTLVVTQPDRPQGRGRALAPPPVKAEAERLGLPVWQPESLKSPEVADRLRAEAPDALVVVAFGRFLPQGLLDLAPHGALNIHPSLLPAYRGPAPINWAIINGDRESGVTIMRLDRGMDSGPLLLSRAVAIGPEETAGQLHDRLAALGAGLLIEAMYGLRAGTITPRPQPGEGLTFARLLRKSDGWVDWTRPAEELARQIRGLDPWPGAFSTFCGQTCKLFGAAAGSGQGQPGQVLTLSDNRLHIAAGRGSLAVSEFQVAGKKRQTAEQFWHGQRLCHGGTFGAPPEC